MTRDQAGRDFRTSVMNIDRPGDPSVFGDDVRAAAAEIIARYPAGQARSALLPMLHLVQSEQGYVTPGRHRVLRRRCSTSPRRRWPRSSRSTRCTSARPTGEYLVSVCTQHAVRAARWRRDLRGAVRGARRRHERDDRRRHDHPRARRVPGRLRLRAGRHGQLRVLRQPDRRARRRRWSAQLRAGERPTADARRAAVLVPARSSARSPASSTRADALEWEATGAPTEAGVRLALERGESAPSYANRAEDTAGTRPVPRPLGQPTSAHDAPLTDC